MPPCLVELVEVIPPIELELITIDIILIHLDVVVEDVPGHICGVEACTPAMEGRSPEVHPQRLRLVHELDRLTIVWGHMTLLNTIDAERDVLGGPSHLVGVPIVGDRDILGVPVLLGLVVPVAVDGVH